MISGKPTPETDEEQDTYEEVLDLRKSCLSTPAKEKLCSWCGKRSVCAPNGLLASPSWTYCSQRCYEKFRRAVFKKRSACLWCSNVDGKLISSEITLQSTLDETKFCSECCLTQFKLKLFCEETTSHLHQIKEQDPIPTDPEPRHGKELITPDLWLRKDRSPPWNETDVCFQPIAHARCPEVRQRQSVPLRVPDEPPRHFQMPSLTSTRIKMENAGKVSSSKRYCKRNSSMIPHFRRGNYSEPQTASQMLRDEKYNFSDAASMVNFQGPEACPKPNSNLISDFSSRERLRNDPQQPVQISILPVPFPFLFPVILSQTMNSRVLDPIEDLE